MLLVAQVGQNPVDNILLLYTGNVVANSPEILYDRVVVRLYEDSVARQMNR